MEGNRDRKRKKLMTKTSPFESDDDDNGESQMGINDEMQGNGQNAFEKEKVSLNDCFDEALNDNCVDDINKDAVMQMTFPSEEDAELFYNTYARAVGFSIRKSDFRMYDFDIVKSRKWVCSCEGKREEKWISLENRKREPKAVTRTGCKAQFRIKLVPENGCYVVCTFVKEHNHKMADKSSVLFMRSHRKVSDGDYTQARSTRRAGVRTSQIMKFFVEKAGGYENMKFLMKDLYNKICSEREKEIVDGDAEGAIAYLAAKQVIDPMFFYRYKLDESNRLCILFWADSRCRSDYCYFGDVLVFDSTYKTNEYEKPLVVLAGVNNHFQTVIFACVLVPEETSETYEWVLETFLNAMDDKKPTSVTTDRDRAMRKVIKKVIPQSKHRLCSWHFQRNAVANVKCKEFLRLLDKCMYDNISEEKFEQLWKDMVEEFGLEDNEWVNVAYRRRALWSNAFLRGYFFAGMKSTQRCEKINDVLQIHLSDKMRLYEFVQAFDVGISCLRHQEAMQHKETEHTTLMIATKFESLERHAMEVYTRRIFFMVREELACSTIFNPVNCGLVGNERVYVLNKYGEPNSKWRVDMNIMTMKMGCSCMTFESIGIPCRHMFKVMELEHMKTIPKSCILNRWTRKARSQMQLLEGGRNTVISEVTQMARYENLCGECNVMCYYASQTPEGYDRIMELVHRETSHLKEAWESTGIAYKAADGRQLFGIKDPSYTRAKGAHKQIKKSKLLQNKCGKCGLRDGHNIRTCNKGSTAMHIGNYIAPFVHVDDEASDDSERGNTNQPKYFDLNAPYLQDDENTGNEF